MIRNLILFPTQMELDACAPQLIESSSAEGTTFEICGFGPIAAAVSAARLIAQHTPQRVLLIGIAGSYSDTLAVGSAFQVDQVACDGIGAGEGDRFQSAGTLGWAQWPGDEATDEPIGDEIDLNIGSREPNLLLTVCSAAGNAEQVRRRLGRWPNAVAEDMEGFGVAMAGRRAECQTSVIRGISNRAGNRDHSSWQIPAALAAATDLAIDWLMNQRSQD